MATRAERDLTTWRLTSPMFNSEQFLAQSHTYALPS